jgi:hypothetical protein
MKLAHFLRMLIEKYFLYWPALEPSSRITMEKLQKCATRNRWRLPPAFKYAFLNRPHARRTSAYLLCNWGV